MTDSLVNPQGLWYTIFQQQPGVIETKDPSKKTVVVKSGDIGFDINPIVALTAKQKGEYIDLNYGFIVNKWSDIPDAILPEGELKNVRTDYPSLLYNVDKFIKAWVKPESISYFTDYVKNHASKPIDIDHSVYVDKELYASSSRMKGYLYEALNMDVVKREKEEALVDYLPVARFLLSTKGSNGNPPVRYLEMKDRYYEGGSYHERQYAVDVALLANNIKMKLDDRKTHYIKGVAWSKTEYENYVKAKDLIEGWDSFMSSKYDPYRRAELAYTYGSNQFLNGDKPIYVNGKLSYARLSHSAAEQSYKYYLHIDGELTQETVAEYFWQDQITKSSKEFIVDGNKIIREFNDFSNATSEDYDTIMGTRQDDYVDLRGVPEEGNDPDPWNLLGGGDDFMGGEGSDFIVGRNGDDNLWGNQGKDYIEGNKGRDLIYGGKNSDTILGGLGGDFILGNIGNDYLYGGQGDDVIYSGKGDDYVYGNKGNDTLYGNKGADTFVCTKGFDVIKDFWGLDGDKISVASVASAVISERDGSTLITSGEGQLLLEGFARQFFDESQYLV